MTGIWVIGDVITAARLNEKSVLSDTDGNITSATKYSGMLAYPTTTGTLTADQLYVRNNANSAWNQLQQVSTTLLTESAEQNIIMNSGAATSTVIGTGKRWYSYFVLGTTYKFVAFTKIEWKNGATINNTITSGIDLVDANPAVLVATVNICVGQDITQAGTSTTQATNFVKSSLVALSTSPIFGVWLQTLGTTNTLLTTTGSTSTTTTKPVTPFTVQVPQQDNSTPWTSLTTLPYFKVYYRGYS